MAAHPDEGLQLINLVGRLRCKGLPQGVVRGQGGGVVPGGLKTRLEADCF